MRKHDILSVVIILIFAILCYIGLFKNFYGKNYSNKIVNIVFTTDVNYKDYLKTTIRTAIASKHDDTVYNINILCVDLPKTEMDKFKKLKTKNVNINPIPLKLESIKDIGNYKIRYNVTRADLFKFFMPDLFPNLDKILYIDVDTAIINDLAKLYNTDIEGKFLGVVHKSLREHADKKMYNKYQYVGKKMNFNCGVMLFNLKLWRIHNIKSELIAKKNQDKLRLLMTQNAFNAVFTPDKIKYLSPKNNIFTQWAAPRFTAPLFWFSFFPYCINGCTYDKLIKNGTIIHYLDRGKPWNNRDLDTSKYWLKYEMKEDYE